MKDASLYLDVIGFLSTMHIILVSASTTATYLEAKIILHSSQAKNNVLLILRLNI